ncbi:MAG: pitrilysin family protein [Azospirillaceae bacterium]
MTASLRRARAAASGARLAAVAAIALLLAGAALPGPSRAQVYDPETFTLDNGLQVVVVTNRLAPVVSHMIWYRAGSADEPAGKSGVAHVLEHMMFQGTEEVPDGQFSRIVARNGGNDNAFTSSDFTAYWQNVAADRLELVMELEADRMTGLALDPQDFATERDVVIEERKQRIDNDPASRLGEQMSAALWRNHPYGTPIIGWQEELERLELADLQAFYDRWYAPNNAVLIVTGDVDAETVRPLAERFYGPIPAEDVPSRTRPPEPDFRSETRVVLRDADVRQPLWRRYYAAPSYATAEGDTAYALEVLSEILGGGSTSRLYTALVVEDRIAVQAGTWYRATALDDTTFIAYAAPAEGVDPGHVESTLEAEIGRLIEEGVSAEELAAAKERLRIEAVYARDSLRSASYSFGQALATGRTAADVEDWPNRIEAVTAEQVVAAARAVLDPARSVTGTLLPEAPAETAAAPPAPAPDPTPSTEVN